MTAATARSTGKRIEKMAAVWLRRRGLTQVFSNYQCRVGELDLVMQSRNHLVIVEVKYRRSGALVSGAESVTPSKQKRLALTTLHMLQRHPHLSGLAVRFDLLSVTENKGRMQVEWMRDAFRPAL